MKAPPPGVRFARKDTEQYHVCVAAPGIARSDRRRFAASLLDAILGGSASSRLFQEIRENRGMAYAVYSFASQYTDTGLVGYYVGTREENLTACLEIATAEIAGIADGHLRANELERAKENLKGRIVLSMEATSNRMSRLGKSLITDTELLSVDRIIAEIDAVEPENVTELAELLLARRAVGSRNRPRRGTSSPRSRRSIPRSFPRPREGRARVSRRRWAACCCPRSRRPVTRSSRSDARTDRARRGRRRDQLHQAGRRLHDGQALPRAGRAVDHRNDRARPRGSPISARPPRNGRWRSSSLRTSRSAPS